MRSLWNLFFAASPTHLFDRPQPLPILSWVDFPTTDAPAFSCSAAATAEATAAKAAAAEDRAEAIKRERVAHLANTSVQSIDLTPPPASTTSGGSTPRSINMEGDPASPLTPNANTLFGDEDNRDDFKGHVQTNAAGSGGGGGEGDPNAVFMVGWSCVCVSHRNASYMC